MMQTGTFRGGFRVSALLVELGREKVVVDFDRAFPPNSHRRFVANDKDGLRGDAGGNLVPIRSAA